MIKRIIEYSYNNKWTVIISIFLAILGAFYSIKNVSLDAIPDLSETQVIVFVEWMGRSPDLIEDQITYPLVTRFLSIPRVKDIRGFSMFGMTFIYIIFEDGTDLYWARSRVSEYMTVARASIPEDANLIMATDATSLGWIFQYALVDKSGRNNLSQLRTFQDFYLKYTLLSVEGVSDVASIGGFLKQYQVRMDPMKLYLYGIKPEDVEYAIKSSNRDVGGRLIEMSFREYYVRGRGYIKEKKDIEDIVIKNQNGLSPIRIKDIADVEIVPDIRRGASDLNGEGEVVGGVVIMREKENALNVIKRIKEKLEEIRPSLPEGVEIVTVYDRSSLIERAINTLKHTLVEEMIVVSLVIIIFLLHFRSALVPIISLPVAVAISFIPMYLLRIDSNIMSLGGIAIAIGAMVDASIVLVENIHKKFEHITDNDDKKKIVLDALIEVGPSIFFSLLIITVAFLPVFTLTGQSGRLFKPLAYTKTFAMFFASILSITLVPAIILFAIKGKMIKEENHPISRFMIRLYRPFIHVALTNPITTILIGLMAVISAIPLFMKLGSEFMPPLEEGDILYMPTTFPNISIEEAKRVLQIQDRLIAETDEVERVFGKVGRFETPTDPAPLSMVETVVKLKPREQWKEVNVKRWYSDIAPEFIKPFLRLFFPEKRKRTFEEIVKELDERLKIPGFTNAWTMPIKARIDMLTTGIRTPVGIKIMGKDIEEIEKIGIEIEKSLSKIEGTRSVYSERNLGALYIDIVPDSERLTRYNLTRDDIMRIVEMAIGGMPVTTTIEGRERYSVNLRFFQDYRSDIDEIKNLLIPMKIFPMEDNKTTMQNSKMSDSSSMWMENATSNTSTESLSSYSNSNNGYRFIRLGDVADVKIVEGPPMIKNENGMLTGYVYVDVDTSKTDIGSFVNRAKDKIKNEIKLKEGYFLKWSGQYELMELMYARMKIVVPITLLIIIILLYLNFKNWIEVFIVLMVLPFSLVGAIWAMSIYNYNISTATIVGIIALLGLAAETGIVMLVYLNIVYSERLKNGLIKTKEDIVNAVIDGAVLRVRPKMMTVSTTFIGLVPLMWATGSGADVMRRLALPLLGGLFTSIFLTLEIIPVIYVYWKLYELRKMNNN